MIKSLISILSILILTITIFIVIYTEPEELIANFFNIENQAPTKNDTQPVIIYGKFMYDFQPDIYNSGVPNIQFRIKVDTIKHNNEQYISNVKYTMLPWNLIESPLYDENGNFGVVKELQKFKNSNVKLQGIVYNPCESGQKLRNINSTPADCLIGIPNTDISLE